MPERPLRRALFLMFLGMGTFFLIAALLALLVWLTAGHWRPFLLEIAFVAMLATIPTAFYLWSHYVIHRL